MLFYEQEGNRALRMGDWKLVAKGRHGQDDVKWELFNINKDRSELHDLSAAEPKRFQSMKTAWKQKANSVEALPWPESKKANTKPNKTKRNK